MKKQLLGVTLFSLFLTAPTFAVQSYKKVAEDCKIELKQDTLTIENSLIKRSWLWNNGSTITSQIWDTVIYAVISFGFGLGWVHTHEGRMQLIGIIIGQYLLKACLALLDTPFFYFFTRNADRR